MTETGSLNSEQFQGTDAGEATVPVLFWIDPRGIRQEISLEKFSHGTLGMPNSGLMKRGRPRMTGEILPALERRVHDLSFATVSDSLTRLSRFWNFLDRCERDAFAGVDSRTAARRNGVRMPEFNAPYRGIDCLGDLPAQTWLLFAIHLRHSGISSAVAEQTYRFVREVIDEACNIRKVSKPDFYRAVFNPGSAESPAKLHSDLDFEVLKFIFKESKRVLRRVQDAPLRNHLSNIELVPDRPVQKALLSTCEGALHYVFADTLIRVRGGEGLKLRGFESRRAPYRKRVEESGIADQSIADYRSVIAPDKQEVFAAFVVITARTGWTDACHSLDIRGEWAVRQTEESGAESRRQYHMIRSHRAKTGSLQTYVSNDGYWSPYSVICRLIERTRIVRKLAAMHRDILSAKRRNGGLSDAENRELARLESVAKSPFAYFSPSGVGTACLSRLFEKRMEYGSLLRCMVKKSTQPNIDGLTKGKSRTVRERASRMKLSDYRHASADRVFRLTGSLYATQLHLGHRCLKSTEYYLSRRQLRIEAFIKYAKLMGLIGEEITSGNELDPRILYVRLLQDRTAEMDPELRRLLRSGGGISRGSGILCADPRNPPKIGAGKNARGGKPCPFDFCVICKNGIIAHNFPGTFESLASRFGVLLHEMDKMNEDDISGSLEDFQHGMIACIRDLYYPDKVEMFNSLAGEHREKLRSREAAHD